MNLKLLTLIILCIQFYYFMNYLFYLPKKIHYKIIKYTLLWYDVPFIILYLCICI